MACITEPTTSGVIAIEMREGLMTIMDSINVAFHDGNEMGELARVR